MTEQGAASNDPLRVQRLADLADFPRLPVGRLPVGSTVLIREPDDMVIALGTPPERVLALLGWTVRNVWLRDTERRDIERRHPIFGNLVAVTAAILSTAPQKSVSG